MSFEKTTILLLFFFSSSFCAPSLVVSSWPTKSLRTGDELDITAREKKSSKNDSLIFLHSRNRMGNSLQGREGLAVPLEVRKSGASYSLRTTLPGGLPLGHSWVVLASPDSSLLSDEMELMVLASEFPVLQEPSGKVLTTTPVVRWQGIAGVPAWHLLLSASPFRLNKDSLLSETPILWESIISTTEISYGESPLQNPASPLVPGGEYYVMVAPNYDGIHVSSTDWARATRSFFTVVGKDSSAIPEAVYPKEGERINAVSDSLQIFRWTRGNPQQKGFYLQIHRVSQENGRTRVSEIFRGFAPDTIYTLNIRRLLPDGDYSWTVSAEDENNNTLHGSASKFHITNNSRMLQLQLRSNIDESPVINGDIRLLSRSGEIAVGCRTGSAEPELGSCTLLVGTGSFDIEVLSENFLPTRLHLGQGSNDTTLEIRLTTSGSLVTGRIIDAEGNNLAGCRITLEGGFLTETLEKLTGTDGVYSFSPGSGLFRITLRDLADRILAIRSIELSGDTIASLGTTTTESSDAEILGSLLNTRSVPLSGVSVTALNSSGRKVAETVSDAQGNFVLSLSPGRYAILLSQPGFVPWRKDLQVAGRLRLKATLIGGASTVEGFVFRRTTFRSADNRDSILLTPLPDQRLFATLLKDGNGAATENSDTLWFQGEPDGRFHVSLSSIGTWFLGALSEEGNAVGREVVISHPGQSKSSEYLLLPGLGGVHGKVHAGSTPGNPSSYSAWLADSATGRPLVEGRILQDGDSLSYEFQNVKRGSYSIHIGTAGMAQDSTRFLRIFDDNGKKGPAVSLSPGLRHFRFLTTSEGDTIDASVELLFPVHRTLTAGDQLTDLGPGYMLLNIVPKASGLLPLEGLHVNLVGSDLSDTTFSFEVKAKHSSRDTSALGENQDSLDLVLHAGVVPDSSKIHYRQDGDWKNLEALNPNDSDLVFRIPISSEGKVLEYWFETWSNGILSSNSLPYRRFHTWLKRSSFFALSLPYADTLVLATQQEFRLRAQVTNGLGLRNTVGWGGSLTWSITGSAIEIVSSTATSVLLKSKSASGITQLTCLAKLGKRSQTLTIPVLVVDAKPQQLNITGLPQSDIIQGDTLYLGAEAADTNQPELGKINLAADFGILPEIAGQIEGDLLLIDSLFIGNLTLTAKSGDLTDTLDREVLGVISPWNTSQTFFHDSTMTLSIEDSANVGTRDILVSANHYEAGDMAMGLTDKSILNGPWSFDFPTGRIPQRLPVLGLSLPPGESTAEDVDLFVYDDSLAHWSIADISNPANLARVSSRNRLAATGNNLFGRSAWFTPLRQWGYNQSYALLGTPSKDGILDLRILPNPFSPLVTARNDGNDRPGTRILFRPRSTSGAHLAVSISIYNTGGELVRTLINGRMFPQSLQNLYWDGTADSGRMLRNGRYLLRFTTRESSRGRKQQDFLESVVLFK